MKRSFQPQKIKKGRSVQFTTPDPSPILSLSHPPIFLETLDRPLRRRRRGRKPEGNEMGRLGDGMGWDWEESVFACDCFDLSGLGLGESPDGSNPWLVEKIVLNLEIDINTTVLNEHLCTALNEHLC
ncbi:hypothetical protein AKJ16_DCAP05362 [Drosera capensis]